MKLPRTPSFRLEGRRALVTGGSSGIGLAAAIALAEAGAEVTIAARNPARMEDVQKAAAEQGLPLSTLELDVMDISRVKTVIDCRAPFDILVNSAGLGKHSPAVDTTEEDFDYVSDINFKSAYFISQAMAKKLITAGKPGSIIHVSSQMAHVGGQERAVYCGTKHAVEGFTKACAIEWGPHQIRINTICPTFIRTPMTAPTFERPELVQWIEEKIKLGRVGELEDMMGPVVFLASDASALITGTHLLVDGGWTAG